MKLVQKLPVALGLACMMMLSSCSKEDVQALAPQSEHVNTNSNEKTEASTPYIHRTQTDYTGEGILPPNWDRNNIGFSSDQSKYPVGISHISRLWGDLADPSKRFITSMPLIPWANSVYTFITVTAYSDWNKAQKSSVKTKIKGLLPGKKYALKVYVGSSVPKTPGYLAQPFYAKSCLLTVGSQETVVDLSYSYYSWVEKVITFTATAPQMDFAFSASPRDGSHAYAHLMVLHGAVQKVN